MENLECSECGREIGYCDDAGQILCRVLCVSCAYKEI